MAAAALFEAYSASLGIDLGFQDFEAEVATLPGRYATPSGALLLARDGSREPAGCIALRPLASPGGCEVKRLYVTEAARGLGLGRSLIEAIIAEARRIGYREMRLDTLPHMHGAIALYRQAGFVAVSAYYDTPLAGTIFMGRSLLA